MSHKVYSKVELLDIGKLRVSKNWQNLDLKFRTPDGDLWFQYSEHVDKNPSIDANVRVLGEEADKYT